MNTDLTAQVSLPLRQRRDNDAKDFLLVSEVVASMEAVGEAVEWDHVASQILRLFLEPKCDFDRAKFLRVLKDGSVLLDLSCYQPK